MSFFHDWHVCHSNRPCRSSLWTLSVPRDVRSLWHHKQHFSYWSDCISTPTEARPLPPSSHFDARNRQKLLIWRWLLSSSFTPHLFKVQLRWNSLPIHTTTKLKAAFWRKGRKSTSEYKNTSSSLQCHQPGIVKKRWMRKVLSQNYISHYWVHSPLCGCQI
jgi:hypothetical protein